LRNAIAEYAEKHRRIEVHPAQVVVGPGAKPALFFPTLALVSPGDEVIYPDPGFPTYAAMIGVAGGTPVPVPLREENDFSHYGKNRTLTTRDGLSPIGDPLL
jgi:aspartate/methionine/tyrosine aminotransferase